MYRPTDQRCEAGRRPERCNEVILYVQRLGADDIDHPDGTLLAHLIRTADLLLDWGARPALALGGLCHALYGTDGFPIDLLPLGRRDEISHLLGVEAEAIVYRYASCDRSFAYPLLGIEGPVPFRDRFTGEVVLTDGFALTDFLELTVANELDLVNHSPAFAARNGVTIAGLLGRCINQVSSPARRAFSLMLECHL